MKNIGRNQKNRNNKKKRGVFITFEGVEGSGKTLQAGLLYKWLKTKGFDVCLTKEPGGTKIGEKIRKILLKGESKINKYTELFLYLADRASHLTEVIEPNLNKNKIVISDRYFDSTFAYQGVGRGINENEIELLKKLSLFSKREPDITFLLDVDPAIAKNRIKKPDRIEKEPLRFHRKVRKAYLKIAKGNPGRVVLINARGSIEETHKKIKEKIIDFLGEEFNGEKKEI
ncbi:MAG: dTMP kinase [candidate division WOR-3 bacterium]